MYHTFLIWSALILFLRLYISYIPDTKYVSHILDTFRVSFVIGLYRDIRRRAKCDRLRNKAQNLLKRKGCVVKARPVKE